MYTSAFKLKHLTRAAQLDVPGKQAYDVYLDIHNLFELSSPCLFYITENKKEGQFASPEQTPEASHMNAFLLLMVHQEGLYESLEILQAEILRRVARLAKPTDDLVESDESPGMTFSF